MASRIAGHLLVIAKGLKGAIEWDHRMSKIQESLTGKECSADIDPEKAEAYRASSAPIEEKYVLCVETFAQWKDVMRF